MKRVILAVMVAGLVGCATSPDKIQTAYVSPLQYKEYDCAQVSGELMRVNRRAVELQGSLQKQQTGTRRKWRLGWCCSGLRCFSWKVAMGRKLPSMPG